MAMTGEDKEIRMQPSALNYPSLPVQTLDHSHDQLIQQHKPPSTNSAGGSKSKKQSTKYRECLKNYAASVGGNVTDGCGEFMPSGDDGTLEALKCAACNCHRNFHRKMGTNDALLVHRLSIPPPLPSPSINQQRAMHANHWTPIVQPVKMAFGFGGGGGSVGTDSSSEEFNFDTFQSNAMAAPPPQPQFVVAKKRSRTKFTMEQKDKMMEFAEKVGWRIPREDDPELQRFCGEVGVKRKVLKVWMHNNKSSGKKEIQEPLFEANAVGADGLE